MRLPNGFGQINKLSGKRRNPYAAYPPSTKRDPRTGHFIKESAIGYYHTKKEAMEALLEWHKSPILVNKSTFKEVYDVWLSEKKKDNLSKQTITTYTGFWRYFADVQKCVYSDLRINDFQNIIDNSNLSWSSQTTLRSMIKQIGTFALKNDYVTKDYAQFTKVRKENDQVKGIPFTEDEINLLWDNVDRLKGVKEALIMIYSGLRIGELKEAHIDLDKGVFSGGLKTDAGKSRTVPIHPLIRDFVKDFNQRTFDQSHYRARAFNPLMDRLKIRYVNGVPHTPHDRRHTFSWLADKYQIDKLSKHLLMGHSPKGVEDLVYGHRTVDELRTAIEQIKR